MPGKDVADYSQALTGTGSTAGVVAVGSTAGFYPKAQAFLSNGTLSTEVIVVSVVDSTHVALRLKQVRQNDTVSEGSDTSQLQLRKPNYGNSDMSGFDNTYTLYMPSQFNYSAT